MNGTSYQFTGTPGQTHYATLIAVSAAGVNSTSGSSDSGAPNPASATTPVILLAAAADQDADGMTNEAEQIAGTNPLSQASALRITSSSRPTGSSFVVTWSSVSGKTYRVQASNTLAAGSFADISGDIVATGASSSFTDTGATGTWKFYQVRVLP